MACVHQFHDELPGTSVAGVYLDNESDYRRVERTLNDTLDASLAEIAARLDTRGEGWKVGSVPVVVYNPLAWTRSEPVRVTLRLNAPLTDLAVRNTDGHDVRQQTPYWNAEGGRFDCLPPPICGKMGVPDLCLVVAFVIFVDGADVVWPYSGAWLDADTRSPEERRIVCIPQATLVIVSLRRV